MTERIIITNLDSEEAQHVARNILLTFSWIGKENIHIEKEKEAISMTDEPMVCTQDIRDRCQKEVIDGCDTCKHWMSKRELAELNASVEDTGSAPRFY